MITALIILVNVAVFVTELMRGDAFVLKWSVVPADIVAGHHWITILTAMFLHGSWSHIIAATWCSCGLSARKSKTP